ncbi:MAG: FAD-binding protein, partial [Gaiellales bacterium]
MTVPATVKRDYPISRLTTVGTGGPARFFARPETLQELREVLDWAGSGGLQMAVVGLGSNLLGADEGFDGLVLKLGGHLAAVERHGELLRCGGGAPLAVVVR